MNSEQKRDSYIYIYIYKKKKKKKKKYIDGSGCFLRVHDPKRGKYPDRNGQIEPRTFLFQGSRRKVYGYLFKREGIAAVLNCRFDPVLALLVLDLPTTPNNKTNLPILAPHSDAPRVARKAPA